MSCEQDKQLCRDLTVAAPSMHCPTVPAHFFVAVGAHREKQKLKKFMRKGYESRSRSPSFTERMPPFSSKNSANGECCSLLCL